MIARQIEERSHHSGEDEMPRFSLALASDSLEQLRAWRDHPYTCLPSLPTLPTSCPPPFAPHEQCLDSLALVWPILSSQHPTLTTLYTRPLSRNRQRQTPTLLMMMHRLRKKPHDPSLIVSWLATLAHRLFLEI